MLLLTRTAGLWVVFEHEVGITGQSALRAKETRSEKE